MSKQEEIREGIEKITNKAYDRYKVLLETGELRGFRTVYELAHDILGYLHSQGVVIKVDRELPLNPYDLFDPSGVLKTHGWLRCREDMLKWHNDSLEPLVIKE